MAMTPALTLPLSPTALRDIVTQLGQPAEPIATSGHDHDRFGALLDALESHYRQACQAADEGGRDPDADRLVRDIWKVACGWMTDYLELLARGREQSPAALRAEQAQLKGHIDRLTALMRTVAVVWAELGLETPGAIYEAVWTIRVPPLAYLRAMWTLFWSAIRHPLSDATIDLSTGRLLYRT